MRAAGRIAATVLQTLATAVKPGVTTYELDQLAEREIRALGGKPSFKGLYSFPACICASINDEIVHGVPSKKRALRDGDIVKLDVGVMVDGYHSDHAISVGVGSPPPEVTRLMEVTRAALAAGIAAAQPGNRVRDISHAIETSITAAGPYGIVRQYVGHGLGRSMHEEPQVPNYVDPKQPVNTILKPGLVIAIEPMVNLGTWETYQKHGDKWTIFTADGKPSAHFEHTVAVTETGPEILTLP